MSEERYVKTQPYKKEKRPYQECPNCGNYTYREIQKGKRETKTLQDLILLLLALSTMFLLDFRRNIEIDWNFYKNWCTNCYYKEVEQKND